MLGATSGWSGLRCSEFLRETGCVGSDLSRGDTGHCGELPSSAPPPAPPPPGALERCCARGSLDAGSDVVVGWSCGVVAADRARCMAAAEGVELAAPGKLGGRCGLTSWLRELVRTGTIRGFCDGLAGDGSREERGVFSAEGEPEAVSESVGGFFDVGAAAVVAGVAATGPSTSLSVMAEARAGWDGVGVASPGQCVVRWRTCYSVITCQ